MTARIAAVSWRDEKGFDDIVVRAQLEPEDAVDLLAPGRDHHDRDI
jgi:hypothetical protein